jgi:hypothetical protein
MRAKEEAFAVHLSTFTWSLTISNCAQRERDAGTFALLPSPMSLR